MSNEPFVSLEDLAVFGGVWLASAAAQEQVIQALPAMIRCEAIPLNVRFFTAALLCRGGKNKCYGQRPRFGRIMSLALVKLLDKSEERSCCG